MATEAQIIANRRNAQNSTGPKTADGKTAASKNSLKHGLTAKMKVIFYEDQEQFDLHRQRILDELEPETPMESILVDRIANLSWRLKRINLIQNQTIDALQRDNKPAPHQESLRKLLHQPEPDPNLPLGYLARKDFAAGRVLERLLMYERRIENSLYKTLLEFQKLQLLRNIKNTTGETFENLNIESINQK